MRTAGTMEPASHPMNLVKVPTVIPSLTADQTRTLLATLLAGAAGGTEAKWRRLIGEMELLPSWKYVRFNWRVAPTGSVKEREAIDKAVEVVRTEHPYVQ